MSADAIDKFHSLIRRLTITETGEPLLKLDVQGQFRPEDDDDASVARNLNAAFMIALSGKEHPLFNDALGYLRDKKGHPKWGRTASFYLEGLDIIPVEVEDTLEENTVLKEALEKAASGSGEVSPGNTEAVEQFRSIFFPEGFDICQRWEEKVAELRNERKITVRRLNPSPIREPARQLLFTSNVLITLPLHPENIDSLTFPPSLKKKLRHIIVEEQLYWYDHPIPIGIKPESNEVLYGLRGLDDAMAIEKKRGTVAEDEKLSCLLSVSVTHRGLQDIAKEYLEEELKRGESLKHLDVYVFTEADTVTLIDDILLPAVREYGLDAYGKELHEIIGVDGEYGRHYTFLKAVSALWQVLVDPDIKGTFKIDLDQVFPQERLVAESGASALEHLKTPLWGAEGVDSQGRKVELGMIAGALVNQKDISKSLFSPDVCVPASAIKADEVVFFSQLPQALSTEAEMMTRYGGETDGLDGINTCIQRIHVTGGTNGILVDSLRRHRPFTPVFIGRAEDQAYIMSILFDSKEKNLRYVHKDGLIMRHDKEVFASEAMLAAKIGKLIGDYTRILWFSFYSHALPWTIEETKSMLDPFTGCFVSHIPFTVVYLRFALKAASFFDVESKDDGMEFLLMGTRRLSEMIQILKKEPNPLTEQYLKEKRVWNTYYDVLDRLEHGIADGDSFALKLREKAKAIVKGCRMS